MSNAELTVVSVRQRKTEPTSSGLLLVIGGRLTVVEGVPAADRISSECWELDWHTDREARGESPGWQHDNVDVLRLGDVHRVVVVC